MPKIDVILFCIAVCQFQVATGNDCYEENTHYLSNLTIHTNGKTISMKDCSTNCRTNSICSHWSWAKSSWWSSSGRCELKYVSPGTPPEASRQTNHNFTSGERYCGSLVPAVCPKMIFGYLYGGSEIKISNNMTLSTCMSTCKERYPGKIYVMRYDGDDECWCAMNNTSLYTHSWYKVCTLPPKGPPKIVKIEGSKIVTSGQNASFFCNPEGGYPVPSVNFTIISNITNYTKPLINKISLIDIPRQKELGFSCIVSNVHGSEDSSTWVTVQWNEIKQIRGNPSPSSGSNQSYVCDVDANPTPKIIWEAVEDSSGRDISLKARGKLLTLDLGGIYSNVSLTCHSMVEGHDHHSLDTSRNLSIFVEWNEIQNISGNMIPMPGMNETYSCNVYANPSPIITWTAVDGNGLDVPFRAEDNNITLQHERAHPNVTLTCYSNIDGNDALSTSKQISVLVEWNQIVYISGNLFPVAGSKETYSCDVDSNPSPKITWTAFDNNGENVSFFNAEDMNISIKVEQRQSNITLICHSNIHGNDALNTVKKIVLIVVDGKSLLFDVLLWSSIILISIIFLVIGITFCAIKSWKDNQFRYTSLNNSTSDIPVLNHVIVQKNDDLDKNLQIVINNKDVVMEVFVALDNYASTQINETTKKANLKTNTPHNRYRDVLPFDNNTVKLKKGTGTPKTTYVNASIIQFPNIDMTFIAAQAPKQISFPNFWQMIVDKKVSTIVMVTGLEEGGKVKAEQYWPDMENPTMEMVNNITIKYVSHSFPGTYYHRRLILQLPNGRDRVVNHVQTTAWMDMTAPKDTKILLDLIYKAQELAEESPDDPILVHCSAGVGRTGTFIALHKLINDYHNPRMKELDLCSTTITMRKQRMKMVQRPQQFKYVLKCLQHYVMAQESVYSNM